MELPTLIKWTEMVNVLSNILAGLDRHDNRPYFNFRTVRLRPFGILSLEQSDHFDRLKFVYCHTMSTLSISPHGVNIPIQRKHVGMVSTSPYNVNISVITSYIHYLMKRSYGQPYTVRTIRDLENYVLKMGRTVFAL